MNKTVALFVSTLILSSVLVSLPQRLVVNAESKTIVVPDDYVTISDAINYASDGDVVFVRNGIYNESLVIDKPISLVGETVKDTIIEGNHAKPVIIVNRDDVSISSLTLKNGVTQKTIYYKAVAGIHLLHANNCKITGNLLVNCGIGVWLYGASNNVIEDNNCSDNNFGIIVESSDNNIISGNRVSSNIGGIRLLSAANNKLTDNYLIDNSRSFSVSGNELRNYINEVDESNTVDGKPICYWVGVSNKKVPANSACVFLVNCNGIEVSDFNFNKQYQGVVLANTNGSFVENNTVSDTDTGITLFCASNNNIVGNKITANTGINSRGNGTLVKDNIVNTTGEGIVITGYNQTVTKNAVTIGVGGNTNTIYCSGMYHNITKNSFAGKVNTGVVIRGSYVWFYENFIPLGETMRISGDWNVVAKNIFADYGVYVTGSYNIVYANNFIDGPTALGIGSDNSLYCANNIRNCRLAISMDLDTTTFNNTIWNNNFVNNEQLIKNIGSNMANFWDNGFEGNYWSGYSAFDENNDGIRDSPYQIISERLEGGGMAEYVCGVDNFPLLRPSKVLESNTAVNVFDAGTWEWQQYEIDVVTNSMITEFSFNPEKTLIQFKAQSESPKRGFCRITIPKQMLSANNDWNVLLNGKKITPIINETAEHAHFYFTYSHYNQKTIQIIGTKAIPEFPAWTILPLIGLAMIMVTVFRKKYTKHQQD